jgi:hypothetical protein
MLLIAIYALPTQAHDVFYQVLSVFSQAACERASCSVHDASHAYETGLRYD